MTLPSLSEIEAAAELIRAVMPPTPQYRWPLLCRRAGAEIWVKHENHSPIGAFKLRGGLVFLAELKRRHPRLPGVIAATRGNHGQSVALAAARLGVPATIVVPHGNSAEKNAAMRGFGAELLEHGQDFQEAYEYAMEVAAARELQPVQSFHPWLVRGTATCGLEFLRAVPDLEAVYVPIGLGSGICGMVAARDALGLRTAVIGVVAERAAAYALSFARRVPVSTRTADTIADGMACRVPDHGALEIIFAGVERIVRVGEAAIRAAMRHYFTDTHNLAEGAGAAALAALLEERERMGGRRVGLVLSGGNVDRTLFGRVLAEA